MSNEKECISGVTGESRLNTTVGELAIKYICGFYVEVWNGYDWYKVVPQKVAEKQEIWEVDLKTRYGTRTLRCTPNQKFILNDSTIHTVKEISQMLIDKKFKNKKIYLKLFKTIHPKKIVLDRKKVFNKNLIDMEYVYFTKIEKTNLKEDIYSLTECETNIFLFNGIVVSN